MDESGFCFSGIPHKTWTIRGTKPILPVSGSHERLNVIGAIDPINNEGLFQFIKKLDYKSFGSFLEYIINQFPNINKIYIILDNAKAHHAKALNPLLKSLQGKIELVFLPPYSPDLSEIETVWQIIKSEVVYNGFYSSFKDFKEALIHSLENNINNPIDIIKNPSDFEKYIKTEAEYCTL